MKNIIEKFNEIIEQAYKANKLIAENGYKWTTGYGPRFRKMMHYRNKRVHSIGIFDYHTKKYVLFEMVNMVGQPKNSIPSELLDMEKLILDAELA